MVIWDHTKHILYKKPLGYGKWPMLMHVVVLLFTKHFRYSMSIVLSMYNFTWNIKTNWFHWKCYQTICLEIMKIRNALLTTCIQQHLKSNVNKHYEKSCLVPCLCFVKSNGKEQISNNSWKKWSQSDRSPFKCGIWVITKLSFIQIGHVIVVKLIRTEFLWVFRLQNHGFLNLYNIF